MAAALPARKPLVRPAVWAIAAALVLATIAVRHLPEAIVAFVRDPAAKRAIAAIHADPAILAAVRAQNAALGDIDEAQAIAHDAQWVAERASGGGPLLATFLGSDASERLRTILAASGMTVRHAIVMDARGLAVAAPWPFHNWRQTPKPKFANTYPRPGALDVGPPEWGHDRSFVACWRTTTLMDPATGAAIGAVGVEIDSGRVGAALCRPTR